MSTEPQIYAIGTCAIGILPNRLFCLTCQPIMTFLCKTNPILSAVGGLQMNVNPYNTTAYENKSNWTLGENEPNTNPIKANFRKAKMNVNSFITKDYRKKDDFAVQKNEPNSNPILSAVGGLQMNLNFYLTKDYENVPLCRRAEFKPKQTQSPRPLGIQ